MTMTCAEYGARLVALQYQLEVVGVEVSAGYTDPRDERMLQYTIDDLWAKMMHEVCGEQLGCSDSERR